jgi:hypothetical protein
MWIRFRAESPYAIKVFVGGVNAISGEPAVETAATRLRLRNRLAQNKPIQDYVVVPNQLWLDGIATDAGKVRQFVAMPVGTGYSVEAQITGEEVTGGIQFEITPQSPYEPSTDQVPKHSPGFYNRNRSMKVNVKRLLGTAFSVLASPEDTWDDLKLIIYEKADVPPSQCKIIFRGKVCEGMFP